VPKCSYVNGFLVIYQSYKNTMGLYCIVGIQPLGWSGQRPELSQATVMALVRCILGKFLGVVCHCFPPTMGCITIKSQNPLSVLVAFLSLLTLWVCSTMPPYTLITCCFFLLPYTAIFFIQW